METAHLDKTPGSDLHGSAMKIIVHCPGICIDHRTAMGGDHGF